MMNKLLLALALPAATLAHPGVELRLGNTPAETKLPKPLSDVSASVGPDGLIYIAGGCDSSFGSQYNTEDENFRCNSVSSSFYAFDPKTEQFTILEDMPDPRYRHAAVAINNQIWLVGGRDASDRVEGKVHVSMTSFLSVLFFLHLPKTLNLRVANIYFFSIIWKKVYDINDGRWRTFRDLFENYWVSDLGGFSAQGKAFFVGGFSEDYRAVRRVFSIDPVASWESGRLEVRRHSNLVHRRGDVGVTIDANETFAYVSGGSTHVNQFCSPLNSVEQYDLTNGGWVEVAPLQQGRTGKTVVQLHDQLVALGGAQEVSKLCNKTGGDPLEMQTPVYEVEVYDQGKWAIVDNLNEYRFRSTSVVYDDTVYSFGGQSVYFTVCQCHPTVDDVVIYRQGEKEEQTYGTDYDIDGEGEKDTFGNSNIGGGDAVEGAADKDEGVPGFGGYQRDGFAMVRSGTSHVSTNFFFAVAIGAVATFFM